MNGTKYSEPKRYRGNIAQSLHIIVYCAIRAKITNIPKTRYPNIPLGGGTPAAAYITSSKALLEAPTEDGKRPGKSEAAAEEALLRSAVPLSGELRSKCLTEQSSIS